MNVTTLIILLLILPFGSLKIRSGRVFHWLIGGGLEGFPKSHFCRGEASRKCLDHGVDVILWIHLLMSLQLVLLEGRVWVKVGYQRCDPEGCVLVPSSSCLCVCFLDPTGWAAVQHHATFTLKETNCAWTETWKTWSKINAWFVNPSPVECSHHSGPCGSLEANTSELQEAWLIEEVWRDEKNS